MIALKKLLVICAIMHCVMAHCAVTQAFTGMSCPPAWRFQEPEAYCVTDSGIPQSGCTTAYGLAYRLDVYETFIPGCYSVLWFWI